MSMYLCDDKVSESIMWKGFMVFYLSDMAYIYSTQCQNQ